MILFVTNDFIFEDQNTHFNMSTSFLFLCDFFVLHFIALVLLLLW